jgi:hypothetical protein
VFFIRDVQTNALLFIGHYANPERDVNEAECRGRQAPY